jgi:excisionase family DNA binding protein
MQAKPFNRYLTSFEVAEACGVSARTVSNWIRHGSIPAHRTVGGHARVAVDDLRKFLEERQMPLPPGLLPTAAPSEPARVTWGRGPRPRRQPVRPNPGRGTRERPRVLVIDDDETLLAVVSEILEVAGYEVDSARHGFLGGYLLSHFSPHVILLDIMMPGLDGYEVLSLIRKRPEARGIPIVACTSLKGPEIESRLTAAGFNGYVRKPIDFSALRATLAALLPS